MIIVFLSLTYFPQHNTLQLQVGVMVSIIRSKG